MVPKICFALLEPVEDGFSSAFAKVEAALELSSLDHAEAMELETWEVEGNSGTIAGFKGKKVESTCFLGFFDFLIFQG